MNNSKSQSFFSRFGSTLLVGLALSLLLFGCSQSNSPVAGFDSVSPISMPPANGQTPGTGSSSLITEYNQFSNSILQGHVKTYYDSTNTYNANMIRLRFTQMPVGLNGSSYIKFYHGVVSSTGSKYYDYNSPLQIVVEDPTTGATLSGASTNLSQSLLSALTPAIAASNIINYNLIISGTGVGYQTIQAAVYSGSNATSTIEFLIPAFDVNPNTYATVHPELLTLHPFYSLMNNGYTTAQYLSLATSFQF